MSDKENQTPNRPPALFSNGFLAARISNTEKPHSGALGPPVSCLARSQCSEHHQSRSYYFCAECLAYSECRRCAEGAHPGHELLGFPSEQQMIEGTKPILLSGLEETLKVLKRKENDVKNRTLEVSLVRNSLKALEEEVMGSLSVVFKKIQTQLVSSLERTAEAFDREVDDFFSRFNATNDQLRDSLMKILDGEIDINTFDSRKIMSEGPELPGFSAQKLTMERHRRVFKDVKDCLASMLVILDSSSGQKEEIRNKADRSSKVSCSKMEKYIGDGSNLKKDKVNQHFMKTLRLLETGPKYMLGLGPEHEVGQTRRAI